MKIKIVNARMVNEGKVEEGDLLISGERIEKIGGDLSGEAADKVIDAKGNFLIPGLIDDQVHFREPGLTHKAEIYTEARAAVAGGITSFMEMPNTVPNTLTQELLQDKYDIAAQRSLANYSFFMGASNDNFEEVMKTDPRNVCGVKIFMGSSTGNMLVDNTKTLEQLFGNVEMLIATHCEDEATIRANTEAAKQKYGENIPMSQHPVIRNVDACYKSSSMAVEMAKKNGSRLHILHISTAKETELFDNSIPLEQKKITSEACIHHLWFTDKDYIEKGSRIKWNPAVKSAEDRAAVRQALLDDRIDVLATDHAPHTIEEKSNKYLKAPSGGPLVQHALPALMEFYHDGIMTIEQIVQKACHNPARLFRIEERGYLREGYYADLVLVNPNNPWTVDQSNILYKCGWSPFEGTQFRAIIEHTFVSGHHVYMNGKFDENSKGLRLAFN